MTPAKYDYSRTIVAVYLHDAIDRVVELRNYSSYLILSKDNITDETVKVINKLSPTYCVYLQTPLWFNITDVGTTEFQDSSEWIKRAADFEHLAGVLVSPMNALKTYTPYAMYDLMENWLKLSAQHLLRREKYVLLQNTSTSPAKLHSFNEMALMGVMRDMASTRMKMVWSPANTLDRSNWSEESLKAFLPLMEKNVYAVRVPMQLRKPLTVSGGEASLVGIASRLPRSKIIVPYKLVRAFEIGVQPYVSRN